jgi:hypothetical protein
MQRADQHLRMPAAVGSAAAQLRRPGVRLLRSPGLHFPGAIAQLEEHLLCKQGVTSSSLVSSTEKSQVTTLKRF